MCTDGVAALSPTLSNPATSLPLQPQPDLQAVHQRRRTTGGFLVQGDLLKGYEPAPPTRRSTTSWIYTDPRTNIEHGEALVRSSSGKRLWLCKHCYNKRQPILFLCDPQPTTVAQRHLGEHGYNRDGSEMPKLVNRKRKAQEQDSYDTRLRQTTMLEQREAQAATYNKSDWIYHFVRHVVTDNVSLRRSCSPALLNLATYRNPALSPWFPQSPRTTRDWITQTYAAAKPRIAALLAHAKSRITISFDGWKSENEVDLLAIMAHFLDADFKPKVVLLSLRNTYGSHAGDEIKQQLYDVLTEYKILDRIAFFMADNATSNDKALKLLAEVTDINPIKQRLRCTGHVINLVCKAILYGVDVDCVADVLSDAKYDVEHSDDPDAGIGTSTVSKFEEALRTKNERLKLAAWRKKGPIGKLHNLILHARATPARRAFFKSKQKEAMPDAERLLHLVINGGIKWNSTCDMLERAFILKDAIDLYQAHYRTDDEEPVEEDVLTTDDWTELKQLHDLLIPLRSQSLLVQSEFGTSKHGALYDALGTIDFLMTKLENLKKEHRHLPSTHFKASINLGWKKLNKYYTLTDQVPAYRASIFAHPHFKMAWFKSKWGGTHPAWISAATKALKGMYSQYEVQFDKESRPTSPTRVNADVSEYEAYMCIEDEFSNRGDYVQYAEETRAPSKVDPLRWWVENCHRYPILNHMAFDLLAAPASSAADERLFSKAQHVLNEDRFNTLDDLAESTQCLKNWFEQGLLDSLNLRYQEAQDKLEQDSVPHS